MAQGQLSGSVFLSMETGPSISTDTNATMGAFTKENIDERKWKKTEATYRCM
jgi:hypothetical protein